MTDSSEFTHSIDSSNTCLFIVDVQNGFISDQTRPTVPRLQKLLQSSCFGLTVFTQFVNRPGSPYEQFLNWRQLSTPEEIDIVQELQPFARIVFKKQIYTSINAEVLAYLKEQQVNTVYVCGIDTDCCVLQTACNLFEHGIRPRVLAHYCASNGGAESHSAGLTVLRRLIGADHIIHAPLAETASVAETPS